MALSYEQLLAVAKQGFSTRRLELEDLVHNLENTEQGNPTMSPGTTSTHSTDTNFCMCGYCREMPTDKERVCCKQRRLCTSRSAELMLSTTFVLSLKTYLLQFETWQTHMSLHLSMTIEQ